MTQQSNQRSNDNASDFLANGGEMGERTRDFDWSRTPLGPAEGWPQSLKTAVRIMLNSRYPMFVWWGRDMIMLYNDAYIPVYGKRHPAALGQSGPVVWSEIWDDIRPLMEPVLDEGRACWEEERLLVMERNGYTEECYFTFSYSPLPDDEGGIGGIFCACSEDTKRVLGERRLRTLRELAARTTDEAKSAEEACRIAARTLAENAHDLPFVLIYLLDGESARLAGITGLKESSPAAPRFVDLARTSAAAVTWPLGHVLEFGRAEVVTEFPQHWGRLPGGPWPQSPTKAVVLPVTKPGQTRLAGFVVVGISPVLALDDEYMGFLNLMTGQVAGAVANARAYEEERRRAESLAELDRAKTTFFSNVSHEFRTPLTLILAPIEGLLARSHGDLPPEVRGELEIVNRNGMRLLRLVNNLLDFSRIEAGRIRAVYRPTNLATLTADLASVFRSACERSGLRLVVDCAPLSEPVFVDEGMWEKIVLNLLSNAFKFTFDGEIVVSLRQVGDRAELRIRDTGTGIPSEEMPRLFERFHRIENARGRTHEGSGIGLALVQELVKLHGGEVAAESDFGVGTTFTVSVPMGSAHLPSEKIAEAQQPGSVAAGAMPYVEEAHRWLPDESTEGLPRDRSTFEPPSRIRVNDDGNRPRVLVADDNADMRRYISRLLAEHCDVEAVPDGEAALAAARARTPDLVLIDVMMPRLDGFGLLRELRADPGTHALPIIMSSARAGEESRVEGMEAGADDYLVKPFSARELLARVTAHLEMARLRREATESIRASEERFRTLFECMEEAFCVVEMIYDTDDRPADYRFLEANPTFEKHTGFKDAVGRTIRDLVPDHDAHWFEIYGKVAATGEAVRFVNEAKAMGRWYDVYAYRVGGPESRKVGILFTDITARKQAEDELRRVTADLAEADRRKDEFLATLAHELRNPLAPLRTGLQVMKLAEADRATVELTRSMMERQLEQMVRLVDDLLDVSRISRGKLELHKEPVSLAEILHTAVETSRPLIEGMGHDLEIVLPKQPVVVEADATRLAQVVMNLLNNAAKYNDRNGRIRLSAEQQGRDVVVSVRDNGIGIAAEQIPRLFTMFSQLEHSVGRSQGGLGIGLTLVKRLVEMHGGTIEARSEGAGRGSEFILRLPVVVEASATQPCTGGHEYEPRSSLRILVVDDNRDGADSLAIMLKAMGNETRTAYDGEEALASWRTFQPNVILLDIGLPKLNGYEACRHIRAQAGSKTPVIIAQTGWGQDEDRQRTQEAGFDYHMVKPVDPKALMRLLAGLSEAENR